MNKTKFAVIASITLLLSVLVITLTNNKTNPASSMAMEYNFNQIRSKAIDLAPEFGFQVDNFQIVPRFDLDKKLVKQVQTKFGVEKSNEILKDYPLAYSWNVIWTKDDKPIEKKNGAFVVIDDEKKISMKFDLQGRLIGLTNNILDSNLVKEITEDEALDILKHFIDNYTPIKNFDKSNISKTEKNERRTVSYNKTVKRDNEIVSENNFQSKQYDYTHASIYFAFSYQDSSLGNQINVTAELLGSKITNFSMQIDDPNTEIGSYDIIPKIANAVISVLIIFFLIFISFKRIRNYEVNFKIYIPIGIFSALALGAEIFLSSSMDFHWEMLIPLIIGPLFYFIFIIFIWAISESFVRENWADKTVTFDLVRNGYADHSLISKSLLSGLSAGFLILALINLTIFSADKFLNIYLFPFDTENPIISSSFPVLLLFSKMFGVFTTIPLILLTLTTILKKRIKNKWVFILIFSLIGILLKVSFFFPWEFGLVTSIILFTVLGFLLIYFDFLSAATAYFSVVFFSQLIDIFSASSAELGGVYFFIILAALLFVMYTIFLFTRDKVEDFNEITPKFVKYINERQRLQSELEIARKVQMSFLPAANPKSDVLDIASNCLPALEVGGDYYDFIRFDNNNLGIVIGDVTGKGTKAAFYMTLTKGFLKAIAKHKREPSEILTEINEVFYENVERGNFISMAFALFDVENKKVRISRAGHNPVLIKQQNSNDLKYIQSKGIAIGLEKGEVFSKSIMTEEISFNSGDIFVFYTDGIPEAMNKKNEEYGMKNFENIIIKEEKLSSAELLNSIYKDVRSFTKNVPQSDDITCVIVKIK